MMKLIIYSVMLIALFSSCSGIDRSLDNVEAMMIENPEDAFMALAGMDTVTMSEQQKARRALLQAYIAVVYVVPVDMTQGDLSRVTSAFDGIFTSDEVKSLIVRSELAKLNGDPIARLEFLKDAEFIASRLGDKPDLGFVYLYLSNIYSNGFNGIVAEHYANKALCLFNELGYMKQSIDARMAVAGAIIVKRDYAAALDSLLSMKGDVLACSTDSYKRYFLDQLARAFVENKRVDEAIALWDSVYADGNVSSNTLAHMAHAYLKNSQPDSAEILINRAIGLPHGTGDEYLCRNVQYEIVERLGRKSELPAIDSLREKAANTDYNERRIAETSLALNKKYDTVTRSAWKEIHDSKLRTTQMTAVFAIILLLMTGGILFYRKRNQLLRVANENNLLRLRSLESNLFEKECQHNAVAEKISTLFKSPFSTIDRIASTYFECKETGQEQKRIFAEAKSAIEQFSSTDSINKLEEIVNTTNDGLMAHFNCDFPKLSASQRRLALFIFCGLSSQSISIFQGTDLRNIYVYKSRLKSTISKSDTPRRELYMAYFA